MASNSFGSLFRITTFGESHGNVIGVVVDGCPAQMPLTNEEIRTALQRRATGNSLYTSPRKESDEAEIVSGVFEGLTTGTPICILIPNRGADPSKYEPIKDLLRPGHANFTYLKKYGIFDYRGGGRASARETAARVAASVVAKKLLDQEGITVTAYLKQLGDIIATTPDDFDSMQSSLDKSEIFCPDPIAEEAMIALLQQLREEGDSTGGVVEMAAYGLPVGLGDPLFDKLEARLAYGILSLPAVKGFEVGSGFEGSRMRGSEHNDIFCRGETKIETNSNRAGGILGGISTGMPLIARAALKPPSSIPKTQKTLDVAGNDTTFTLPPGSKHDPCTAIRAVPIIEAVLALVLADRILVKRSLEPKTHALQGKDAGIHAIL